MRRVGCILLAAGALAIGLAAPAQASTYRGAGVGDPGMPVKVVVEGRNVNFSYADVLVNCTDGSQVRQGGAVQKARLGPDGRFKDALEVEGDDASNVDWTTSIVHGKVTEKKATGTLSYDLSYDGGDCESGEVRWVAKRR